VRRPTKVVVGPFIWRVSWSKSEWATYHDASLTESPDNADAIRAVGMTYRRDRLILINPMCDEQVQREALLHEVLHACQFTVDLPNEGQVKGHDFITRITPMLLDALLRSPGLAGYLLRRP
jgi:hypothetical protein